MTRTRRLLRIPAVFLYDNGPDDGLLARLEGGRGTSRHGKPAVFGPMSDEMKRTLDRLNMENLGLPYFLAYTVRDTRRVEVSASFGALKEFDDSRYRRVSLDLRVGSSLFDNTHYIPKDTWNYAPALDSLVLENDYDALRYDLLVRDGPDLQSRPRRPSPRRRPTSTAGSSRRSFPTSRRTRRSRPRNPSRSRVSTAGSGRIRCGGSPRSSRITPSSRSPISGSTGPSSTSTSSTARAGRLRRTPMTSRYTWRPRPRRRTA